MTYCRKHNDVMKVASIVMPFKTKNKAGSYRQCDAIQAVK